MENDTIFVQIASYRDSELVPTVLDCLKQAKHPQKLRIGICWQFADSESIAEIAHLPQVRFVAVPHNESKGACWAREIASNLYDGQEFFMQIDSHHRFAQNWDYTAVNMLKALEADGVRKPLITAYPPEFDPKNDPAGRAKGGVQIDFKDFLGTSVFSTGSSIIKNWENLNKPIRGRFFAGGFVFVRSAFLQEVPSDPNIYFQGEEMNMAFRSFSHGYDIYHPHKPFLWHYYIRKDSPKHWNDNVQPLDSKLVKNKDWQEMNESSFKRTKQFFSYDGYRYEDIDWGKYGRGKERSLRDYELFCGLDFRQKRITKDCLNKTEPGSTWNKDISDADWDKSLLRMCEHTIEIGNGLLPLDDYDFIYVGYDRADGSNIYCTNITGDILKKLMQLTASVSETILYPSRFFSDQIPSKWVFWPHSKSKGWTGHISSTMPKMIS
jgi:hypothetical protein